MFYCWHIVVIVIFQYYLAAVVADMYIVNVTKNLSICGYISEDYLMMLSWIQNSAVGTSELQLVHYYV